MLQSFSVKRNVNLRINLKHLPYPGSFTKRHSMIVRFDKKANANVTLSPFNENLINVHLLAPISIPPNYAVRLTTGLELIKIPLNMSAEFISASHMVNSGGIVVLNSGLLHLYSSSDDLPLILYNTSPTHYNGEAGDVVAQIAIRPLTFRITPILDTTSLKNKK